MTIFLVLAIYLLIIHITVPEWKKMKKSILAALGFVIVLALRSPYCGLDVTGTTHTILPSSYAGVFFNISNWSFLDIIKNSTEMDDHMEIGWLILTKLISLLTNNLQVFLSVVAIIQFGPIAYIIGKYSKNVILSYFIFACLGFYIHFFSGIRQMMAVSIILLAFDQLNGKRYVWFFVITILASTIHKSAIFVLLLWPLSFLNLTFLSSLFVIIVMVVLMPFYNNIAKGLLDAFFDSRYNQYLDDSGQATTMFVVYSVLMLTSFISKKNDRYMGLLRMVVLTGVACQSLGVLSGGAITRIAWYFTVLFVLLLPEVVVAFKEKKTITIINIVATILLCVFFTMTVSEEGSSGVIPYKFFWEAPAV